MRRREYVLIPPKRVGPATFLVKRSGPSLVYLWCLQDNKKKRNHSRELANIQDRHISLISVLNWPFSLTSRDPSSSSELTDTFNHILRQQSVFLRDIYREQNELSWRKSVQWWRRAGGPQRKPMSLRCRNALQCKKLHIRLSSTYRNFNTINFGERSQYSLTCRCFK